MKFETAWIAMTLALVAAPAIAQPRPATPPRTTAAPAAPSAANPQPTPGTRPAPAPGLTLDAFLDQQGQAFSLIDTDHDGVVSSREFADHRTRTRTEQVVKQYQTLFTTLDVNRDGTLSGAEFMKLAVAPPPQDTRPDFEALDTNRDSRISRSEFLVRMTTNFDRLDANKDGTISEAELAAQPRTPAMSGR